MATSVSSRGKFEKDNAWYGSDLTRWTSVSCHLCLWEKTVAFPILRWRSLRTWLSKHWMQSELHLQRHRHRFGCILSYRMPSFLFLLTTSSAYTAMMFDSAVSLGEGMFISSNALSPRTLERRLPSLLLCLRSFSIPHLFYAFRGWFHRASRTSTDERDEICWMPIIQPLLPLKEIWSKWPLPSFVKIKPTRAPEVVQKPLIL